MKSSLLTRGRENSGENGQGFLEYSVIIGLVVIIIISFVALFGVDLYNKFLSNRARANEEQGTQIAPEPQVELFETGTLTDIFDTEVIRVENCPGGSPYNPNIERQFWLDYEVELENEFAADLRPQVISKLQDQHGFSVGAREDRTLSLNLGAPPDSIIDYTIAWKYLWNEGNIVITQSDGSWQSYPYRVRTGLEYEIMEIEQLACEATPYP
jgi:hypothetical protein